MGQNKVLTFLMGGLVLILVALMLFTCARQPFFGSKSTADELDFGTPKEPSVRTPPSTAEPTQTPSQNLDPTDVVPVSSSTPTLLAGVSLTPTSTNTATEIPVEITVISSGGSRLAMELSAETGCGVNGAMITFRWIPGSGSGIQQVDLSNFNNDFIFTTYRSSAKLSPGVGEFSWGGLGDGVQYYWRVRSQSDQGWFVSETATIETEFCGGDSANP